MSVTLDTFHDDISPLNDVASANMWFMSVTLDVSQDDMSWLKTSAL